MCLNLGRVSDIRVRIPARARAGGGGAQEGCPKSSPHPTNCTGFQWIALRISSRNTSPGFRDVGYTTSTSNRDSVYRESLASYLFFFILHTSLTKKNILPKVHTPVPNTILYSRSRRSRRNIQTCFSTFNRSHQSRDSSVGVRFPAGAGNFSLRHHVQTGSGAHEPLIQ
jgi:hypothetical protein